MKISYAGLSEPGAVRSVNEDAILIKSSENAALFMVADGIGGRAHGEIVSALLRDEYARWWEERFLPRRAELDFRAALEQLKRVLAGVNGTVVARYGELASGSTIVLLFLFDDSYAYLSAGDSRIYRARGLSLRQLTWDDVFENSAPKPGGAGAAASGKLTAAVGIRKTLDYSLSSDSLRSTDRFFLCSDGVYRFLPFSKLRTDLLCRGLAFGPEAILRGFANEIEKNGAGDNYSMIFVRAK